MAKFYSHIRIGLNCKNLEKAKKLSSRIEKAVQLTLEVTEFQEHENNKFDLVGHFLLDSENRNEAVFNWLIHLEQLGYTWNVHAPNIYEDYFSFEGERWNEPQQFKIPGLTYATFELTDRDLNYYDNAPFTEYEDVRILESDLTKEENIVGLTGYISGTSPRTGGIWYLTVYIHELERSYVVSENEIELIAKDET